MLLNNTIKSNILTQILNAVDAGAGAATLKFYTGAAPSNLGAITSQTLLGTLTFSDPCGSVSGGTLTFSTITPDTNADATGTAGWARLQDSDGVIVGDFTVGTSAADIILNTVSIVTDAKIGVNSFTITLP